MNKRGDDEVLIVFFLVLTIIIAWFIGMTYMNMLHGSFV